MILICWLRGRHDWGDPLPVSEREPVVYEATCQTCGSKIKGDWDHLEQNKVWKHWRSTEVGLWPTLKVIWREWRRK